MSLDASLPIFHLRPSATDPTVTELVDGRSRAIYTRRRTPGDKYESTLEDSLYGALFSTVTAPDSNAKKKTVTLHNPDQVVELSLSGRLTFTWSFAFEEEQYEWRQSKLSKDWTLMMLRGSDAPIDVARARSGDPKVVPFVTLQTYNLGRFDCKDPKGLEIVILSSFISFIDAERDRNPTSPDRPILAKTGSSSTSASSRPVDSTPPPLPPKPDIREQLGFGDYEDPPDPNEVVVKSTHPADHYAERAFKLLNDPSILFIVIRAKSVDTIQKAVLASEATKRLRHTRWQEVVGDDEIHQYVVEEKNLPSPIASPAPVSTTPSKRQPPRVINLDAPGPAVLSKPPPSPPPPPPNMPPQHPWDAQPISALSIYLSKIVLPDLQPRAKRASTSATSAPSPPARDNLAIGRPAAASSSAERLSPSPSPGPTAAPAPAHEESRFGRLMDGFGRLGLGSSGGGGLRVNSPNAGAGGGR